MANNAILLLVVQTSLILALSRIMGWIFIRFRQPQVMGEMIAGIMLGPSLFGWLLPHPFSQVFPTSSIQYLNALGQIGIVVFLFLIGLELDLKMLRNRGHTAIVTSNASILAPFVLGIGLVAILYRELFSKAPAAHFTSVALFVGAAMSITAFPVLARILTERNLHRTPVGALAITCAAVNDVMAWCLLAVVVAIARASGLGSGLWTAVEAIIYVLAMFFLVRPFLRRLQLVFERENRCSQHLLSIILLLVLGSAIATEWIGIHALFGAFVMGVIMPKGTRFVHTLTEKLNDFVVVFLLPIFFAYTGLRTQIGLLNHASLWGFTALIVLTACLGKFGGSTVAARICGLSWRQASAIGILMNTRGLIELVILNIGRDLGVISDAVFVMMVIMAIVTTAMTTPFLHWVYPQAEEEAAKPLKREFVVLVPVALPASGGPLATMASLLAPTGDAGRRIVGLHLQRPDEVHMDFGESFEPTSQRQQILEPLLTTAKPLGMNSESIAFVSRDVPSDIARMARSKAASLILMGFHKPIFGRAILGGTVHRVMTASECDVAVYVDRGQSPIKSILVPFMGGKHDRLALELAGRVARNVPASLTILHVVPPNRAGSAPVLHARTIVDRHFSDPTEPTPVEFKVIEDPSPVDAVVRMSQGFDLLVIGVEEQWGMESHLFGWQPERIAIMAQSSMLIVRRYAGPTTATNTPIPESQPVARDAVAG